MTRAVPKNLRALDPPAAVREIVARLERAGYETWCVGGAVRDALLGQGHLDWDFATAATPQQTMQVFKRTVPVGVEFGTVGVFDSEHTMHEVTTFRRDVKTDGRHAVVEFGVSLDDDLARRDFTINALAYHPAKEEFRDLYEGRVDLERGIVRAVGTAADRMREDRLRALRGIRFASRFGFHIEPDTWRAIVESAPHMGRLSAERVHQELEKTMQQVEKPSIALEWWRESGALAVLVPAIANAPTERFAAIDYLPKQEQGNSEGEAAGRTLDRLAMLFFGETEKVAANTTKALKFSNAHSAWIAKLADAAHTLGAEMDKAMEAGDPTDAEIRKWVAAVGRTRATSFATMYAARLSAALPAAPSTPRPVEEMPDELSRRLKDFKNRAGTIAYRDPIELNDLAIDGEDLSKVGIPPGPKLGKILQALLQDVIVDPKVNTREELLARATKLAEG